MTATLSRRRSRSNMTTTTMRNEAAEEHEKCRPRMRQDVTSTVLPQYYCRQTWRRQRRRKQRSAASFFSLVFCVIILLTTTTFATDCPIQIRVFDTLENCQNPEIAALVTGQLFADRQCRETQILQYSRIRYTTLLPGRYVAYCLNPHQVDIEQSGCAFDECVSTQGNGICSRNRTSVATLYSRNDPPVYPSLAQSEFDGASSEQAAGLCQELREGDQTVAFQLVGDCSDASCTLSGNINHVTDPRQPTTAKESVAPTLSPTTTSVVVDDNSTSSQFDDSDVAAGSNDPAVPDVTAAETPNNGPPPEEAPSGGLGLPLIIGLVVAAVVVFILVLLCGYMLGKRRSDRAYLQNGGSSNGSGLQDNAVSMLPTKYTTEGSTPDTLKMAAASGGIETPSPQNVFMNKDDFDDVSTLGTPIGLAFVDDAATTATSNVDMEEGSPGAPPPAPPEKKSPISATPQSTSSFMLGVNSPTANMIMSSLQRSGKSLLGGGTTPSKDEETAGAASPFGQVPSFSTATTRHLSQSQSQSYYSQDNIFEVTVPPGKLGMVIDDPHGYPQVIAIKPDSVLQGCVVTGDRLVAVDDFDVTDLTCLETSNLISRKSERTRQLRFSRGPLNPEDSESVPREL